LYPIVNESVCIECGICEKVCPVINKSVQHLPINVLGVKNPNAKVRLTSSSGGVFTMLSENIIDRGGVVFGARFNDDFTAVLHDFTTSTDGIKQFIGSKYLQSDKSETFRQVEVFLKDNKLVLYSGTPCEISGLKHYLRRDYPNLFTVDIVCHGVPGPFVWRSYIKHIMNGNKLTSVSFRDKSTGWKSYSTKYSSQEIVFCQNAKQDIFMRGFLSNFYLRPSCYDCPTKPFKGCSDLTLGDYWGIEKFSPAFDDDKGVCAVLINTGKGENLFESLNTEKINSSIDEAVKYNPSIIKNTPKPSYLCFYFSVLFKVVDSKAINVTLCLKKLPRAISEIRHKLFRLFLK
jgi:ferredoxin